MAQQKITILTEMVDKVSGAAKKINKEINMMGNGVINTTQTMKGFNARGKEMNQVVKTSTTGVRRFKMEWLGVMFAGMAIYRVFGGLIRKQLELWGITEGFGSMLTVLFIPVMETLSNILWPIIDFFMGLPEPMQAVIGWFILLTAGAGLLLMVMGQIALGWSSIVMAFSGGIIVNILMGIKAALLSIWASFGFIISIVGAFISIIIGIVLVVKGFIMIVKNWGDVWHKVVKGVSYVLIGLAAIILGIAIFAASVPLAIAAAVIAIIASIVWLVSKIIEHWDKVKAFVKGVVDAIVGFFQWLWDKLVGHSIIPDIVNGIIDWFMKIPNAIAKIAKSVVSTFEKMIPSWLFKVLKGGTMGISSKLGGILGFASGGIVPGPIGSPTLAMVHGGETITPPGAGGGSPNITINATISNDYDVRRLAEQLKRYWVTDFERVSKGRGI